METFVCHCCKKEKTFDRAPKRFRDGSRSVDRCLDCNNDRQREARRKDPNKTRSSRLKSTYGISLEEWNKKFEEQNRSCAICFSKTPNDKQWHTDHNHETGQIRDILCSRCNHVLGHARENPMILLDAFGYLCRHSGNAEEFITKGNFDNYDYE